MVEKNKSNPVISMTCPPAPLTPLTVSYGAGVNSTAMLIGFLSRGIRPDLILFANPGSEKSPTYGYISVITEWLKKAGFPRLTIVRYQVRKFKYGPYRTIGENCIRNATLPSLAFGRKACSMKWKAAPQNAFCEGWEPAIRAWRTGLKVRKAIGFDYGPKDSLRYAVAGDRDDEKYEYIIPCVNGPRAMHP